MSRIVARADHATAPLVCNAGLDINSADPTVERMKQSIFALEERRRLRRERRD